MPGKLVVCPTPIGNLEDVTLRVLSALREADQFGMSRLERGMRSYVEDFGKAGK